MYFSGVLRGDWPPAVDARPLAQLEESVVGVSSESGGTDAGRTKSSQPVSEKARGKRAAVDEPAQKRRKTATTAPIKLGGISLGDDQTTRTRRTAVFDWSDDDKVPTDSPPSTKEPPRSTLMGNQSRGGKEVPELQTREVPKQRAREVPTQQMMGVPAGQATGVPEQQVDANPEQQAERALELQTE